MPVFQASYIIPTRPWQGTRRVGRDEISGSVDQNFLPLSGGTMSGNILSIDNAQTLGDSSDYFADIYTVDLFVDEIKERVASDGVQVTGDLFPAADDTETLGRSGRFWMSSHVTDAVAVRETIADNIAFIENATPPSGSTAVAKIYAADNGGQTELLVIFETGSAIRLAIEA